MKKKTKKVVDDGRPKCDQCGKLATRNLQELWVEWSINKKGEYSKKPVNMEHTGGDNVHLCDDCEY